MKLFLVFLTVILFSCSKSEKNIDSNNGESHEIIMESIDNSLEIDYEAKLFDFLRKPFMNENIIYPFLGGYASFDELYNHLGNPISEYSQIKGVPYLDDARFMTYEYYSISALLIPQKNSVDLHYIDLRMRDDVLYNYDIKKDDTPDKIKETFGEPYSIGRIVGNVIDYSYFFGFDVPQIVFQFTDEKLWRIVFTFMAQ